ncbi:hypothetical protein HMPREF1581_00366 [Gardnerella vaginalis JCP8108]|uniref:Uncharacterized protein n=1 Tax=Gardnerella vaginalis JCP8108 TaxID=1261066 RepID=S4GTX1_GARVA|nr:hypothetical protein HMPREF1581_00366 [Gardnerella vaginalis JCP8108]
MLHKTHCISHIAIKASTKQRNRKTPIIKNHEKQKINSKYKKLIVTYLPDFISITNSS